MRISQELAADLRWLAETEQWDEEDRAEAKRCLRGDPAFFCHFFTVWVKALRAGYKFQVDGRYVLLADFCARNGLPDPYKGAYTDAEVDGGNS